MNTLENILIAVLSISWIGVSLTYLFKGFKKQKAVTAAMAGLHASVLIYRAVLSGHMPLTNIYESLIFFALLSPVKGLFVRLPEQKKALKIIYTIPSFILLAVALFMPSPAKIPGGLEPALRSPWLYIHVPTIFLGYVSLFSVFILIIANRAKQSPAGKRLLLEESRQAFFFLTVGIITGAFWAWQSWSSFWSWDPKEIWALITWLFTIMLLHSIHPLVRKISGILAFAALLFTYFGVTYLLSGLHSYG